jgi:hypothetical protein
MHSRRRDGCSVRPRGGFFANYPPPQPLHIDDVEQKSYVKLDEEGIEAAATSVGVVATFVTVTPPQFKMIADHPFFCAIVEKQSGAMLFAGVVTNPRTALSLLKASKLVRPASSRPGRDPVQGCEDSWPPLRPGARCSGLDGVGTHGFAAAAQSYLAGRFPVKQRTHGAVGMLTDDYVEAEFLGGGLQSGG